MEEKARPIRVAIVGSGMAGLVTAYLLQRDVQQRYEVKVLESVSATSEVWTLRSKECIY